MYAIFKPTYISLNYPFSTLYTGSSEKQALPYLQDIMLKRDKRDVFLFLLKCSCPKLWGFYLEIKLCLDSHQGNDFCEWWGIYLAVVGKMPEWLVYKHFDLYRAEATVYSATMQKKKEVSLGDFARGAYNSKRYGG